MAINNYSIGDYSRLFYWWLLVVIPLMAIVAILLMATSGYFINGYS